MIKSNGYASFDATSDLKPYSFSRRELGKDDVLIKIKYSGICHSDIHTVRNEWGGAQYPLVPGHEIIGVVEKIGTNVTKFKEGEIVGVGCMVGSCKNCVSCENHLEQFCEKGCTFTYNSIDADGKVTQGGYSNNIVVNQQFVLKIPSNLNIEATAPLLCAGITTYSPLKHWEVGLGQKVGIIGLGGLGHMAVKFAKSFGAYVVVFTTSPNKKEDALKMGADDVILSTNPKEMKKYFNKLNFILDTVSAPHEVKNYLELLKFDGTLCMVGVPPEPFQIPAFNIIFGRKSLSGSLIGGIKETQEMLDYCGKHNITCDVEIIPIHKVNEAYQRVLKSDVKYRFVIDIDSLQEV